MEITTTIQRGEPGVLPICTINIEFAVLSEQGEPNVDFVLAEMKNGIMGAWANFVEREKKKAGGKADSWKS